MAKLSNAAPYAEMFLVQTVYVFLFAFIMMSGSVYKQTSAILPVDTWNNASGAPTNVGLAVHASVYVLLIFALAMMLKKKA